jgi:hypothetical protein
LETQGERNINKFRNISIILRDKDHGVLAASKYHSGKKLSQNIGSFRDTSIIFEHKHCGEFSASEIKASY